MSPFPNQPTLPAEEPMSDVERLFVEESPVGLWPENQDSNFGQLRRVITTPLQDAVDITEMLFNERFIDTMASFLDVWESELGIPEQTNKTDIQRKSIISSRLHKGAFTRARRDSMIEEFIQATFGTSVALTPEGLSLPAGGVPLFADTAPVSTLYRVYEDIVNSSYTVWIVNTVTPDLTALQRELAHFTPAGISFTIDNTKANILDYQRTILTDGPTYYWPLVTTSGTGNPWNSIAGIAAVLTPNSAPTNVSPLISNGGGVVADAQARDFDGVDDYLSYFPATDPMKTSFFTAECWVNLDTVTTGQTFLEVEGRWELGIIASKRFQFRVNKLGGGSIVAESTVDATTATTYHLVGIYDGEAARLYVNGVLVSSSVPYTGSLAEPTGGVGIGIPQLVNGRIDEPAIYGHRVSPERILIHNNTGRNIL